MIHDDIRFIRSSSEVPKFIQGWAPSAWEVRVPAALPTWPGDQSRSKQWAWHSLVKSPETWNQISHWANRYCSTNRVQESELPQLHFLYQDWMWRVCSGFVLAVPCSVRLTGSTLISGKTFKTCPMLFQRPCPSRHVFDMSSAFYLVCLRFHFRVSEYHCVTFEILKVFEQCLKIFLCLFCTSKIKTFVLTSCKSKMCISTQYLHHIIISSYLHQIFIISSSYLHHIMKSSSYLHIFIISSYLHWIFHCTFNNHHVTMISPWPQAATGHFSMAASKLFDRSGCWDWNNTQHYTACIICVYTSSAAQGGGGSFKNRKPIGGVGCCESRIAEQIHWWTQRWLGLCFLAWLQWLQWSPGRSPHPQLPDVVWCSAAVVVVVV